MTTLSSFDLDFRYGYAGEQLVEELLTSGKTVEVKRDRRWHETGNLYIEFDCWYNSTQSWQPSGISVTKADYWAFVLEERLVENYKLSLKENNNEHFTTKEELKEFLSDGQSTLDWLKKNRKKYFSIRNTELVGIEIPILQPVLEDIPNVLMNGSIDFIIYEKNTESYTIYDIKTSTKGWSDYEKKDQTKINQILLYKRFYSKVMNVPEDKIDVKFFIVKRKVYQSPDYPIYRVQEFVPSNGKKKVEDAVKDLSLFIRECFTPDAKYKKDRLYPKNLNSCRTLRRSLQRIPKPSCDYFPDSHRTQ